MKRLLFILFLASSSLAQTTLHVPQTAAVLLMWNSSPASDIGGYIFGQKRNNFNPPVTEINVGNVTSYVRSGLACGLYYFDVKAFDTANNQSDWSDSTVTVSIDTVIVPEEPGGTSACDTANLVIYFYRPTTIEGGAPLEYDSITKFSILIKTATASWNTATVVADSIQKTGNPIKWCGFLSFPAGNYNLAVKCHAYVDGHYVVSDIGKATNLTFPIVPQTIKPASMRKPSIIRR